MKRILDIIIGLLVGLIAAGLIWIVASPPRGRPIELLPEPTSQPIKVYVTGAVQKVGVYLLPEGSRIGDAIDAAGGFAKDADNESINLAALVYDGDQIHVPRNFQSGGGSSVERINVNIATIDELDALPGIGPTLAENVVNYRLAHGPFRVLDDLLEVPGMGPATLERIRDMITLGS
jgi:competence protein ComEA